MRKLLNYIVVFLFFLLSLGQVSAQETCFIQLDNFTGFELSQSEFDELNQTACELVDSLPQQFQDSFKVYDFGFYLHNENMVGGIENKFIDAKQKAISLSNYYILFFRGLSNDSLIIKVDIKFPSTSIFACYSEDYFVKIKDLIEYNLRINELGKTPINDNWKNMLLDILKDIETEIDSMEECCSLEGIISTECSSCVFESIDIKIKYANLGFDVITIDNVFPAPLGDESCLCDSIGNSSFSQSCGLKYCIDSKTKVDSFIAYGYMFNIDSLIDKLVYFGKIYDQNNIGFYACITDNTIFCDQQQTTLIESYSNVYDFNYFKEKFYSPSNPVSVGIHINHTINGKYELYVNVKGNSGRLLDGCFRYIGIECYESSDCDKCERVYWVTDRLSNYNNIYTETIKEFKTSKFDLLISVDFTVESISEEAKTTPISSLLKNKIKLVTISLEDDEPVEAENFCDNVEMGYLTLARNILHECVHAYLNLFIIASKGDNSIDKYTNTHFKDVSKYAVHLINTQPTTQHFESLVEHYVLHAYYIEPITYQLWEYNNRFGKPINYAYHLYKMDRFEWTYKLPISDYNKMFGTNYSNYSDLEEFLRLKHKELEANNELPCFE